MGELLSGLASTVIGAAICGAFAWIYSLYLTVLSEPKSKDFADLRRSLDRGDGLETAYTRTLRRVLMRADRFFEGKPYKYEPPTVKWSTRATQLGLRLFGRPADYRRPDEVRLPGWRPNPWSANSYDRCLLLAIVYPVLAALVGWTAFGDGGTLAASIGLQAQPVWVVRILVAGAACVAVAGVIGFFRLKGWRRWFVLVPVLAVPGVGAFAATLAIALALTISGASTGNGIGTFSLAFSFFLAFVFALAPNFSDAFAVSIVDSLDYIEVAFIIVVLVGVVAAVIAFAGAVEGNRLGRLQAVLPILLIVAIIYVASTGSSSEIAIARLSLLLALCLLPLINAPFDWASIGLTRTLLYRNLDTASARMRFVWSALDLFGALALLVLLALTSVLAMEAFNAAALSGGAATPPVDVAGMLADIGAEPYAARHFWLYFALFSTLLPTLIHCLIWVVSTATVRIGPLQRWLIDGLDHRLGHGTATQHKIAAVLTLRWLLPVPLVLGASIWLLALAGQAPWLGGAFLTLLQNEQMFVAAMLRGG